MDESKIQERSGRSLYYLERSGRSLYYARRPKHSSTSAPIVPEPAKTLMC